MVKSRASKYRGVYRCGTKWKAQIQIDGIQHYLGVFDDQESAAEAYKDFARKKGRFLMIENYSNDTMQSTTSTTENEVMINPFALSMTNTTINQLMKTDESTSTLSIFEKEFATTTNNTDTLMNMEDDDIHRYDPPDHDNNSHQHQGMQIDFDSCDGLLLSNLTEESFSNLPFNTQTFEKGIIPLGSYPTLLPTSTEHEHYHETTQLPPPSSLDESIKIFIKIRKLKILLGKCLCAASMNNLTHFQHLIQSASSSSTTITDTKLQEITERSFQLSENIQLLANEILKLQQNQQENNNCL